MSKFDVESTIDDLITLLKAKMPAKVAEINAEKGDSLLTAPTDDAYFFETLDDETANYDPFVYCGIATLVSVWSGANAGQIVSVEFVLTFAESTDAASDSRRMLRYHRAIREVFENSFDKVLRGRRIQINNLEPVTLSRANSTQKYRAVGVTIETGVA